MINVSLADLLPKKEEEGTSEGLIRGVAAKLKEEGYEIGGFEAYVTSDVLNGAGMSSSAAFEVLTGNILSGLYNEERFLQCLSHRQDSMRRTYSLENLVG